MKLEQGKADLNMMKRVVEKMGTEGVPCDKQETRVVSLCGYNTGFFLIHPNHHRIGFTNGFIQDEVPGGFSVPASYIQDVTGLLLVIPVRPWWISA
jgi:hypothetical protein